MSRLVAILGAGASAGIGLPMLSQVFKVKEVSDYLTTNAHDLLRFLEEYIWIPRGIQRDQSDQCLHIEEILTLLRQWSRAENSPIPQNLNDRIQKQLLGCIPKAVYTDKGRSDAGLYMNKLVEWCDSHYDDVTWATFNWDMKLEQSFWYCMRQTSLPKLEWLPRCHSELRDWNGTNRKHYLIKLHGSVSWFELPDGKIHSKRFGARKPTPIDLTWDQYLGGSDSAKPVIAEPSFFKHEVITEGTFLWKQWHQFHAALGQADNVLICGYSLPDGDALAKQALLTAVAVNDRARWTVVDPSPQVLEKFQRLLGQARTIVHEKRLGAYVDRL